MKIGSHVCDIDAYICGSNLNRYIENLGYDMASDLEIEDYKGKIKFQYIRDCLTNMELIHIDGRLKSLSRTEARGIILFKGLKLKEEALVGKLGDDSSLSLNDRYLLEIGYRKGCLEYLHLDADIKTKQISRKLIASFPFNKFVKSIASLYEEESQSSEVFNFDTKVMLESEILHSEEMEEWKHDDRLPKIKTDMDDYGIYKDEPWHEYSFQKGIAGLSLSIDVSI